ncbi:MAG: ATP synthase F1 subunit gamma [Elusimicrobiota bacterium]|nr:ATP synthase F1 subunit gamma [Elusimicrobiota bacterium]
MQSLRDIRQEIKSIKATQQIMLTMKMISSARIKKAQRQMEDGRPFAEKMAVMIDNLRRDIENPQSAVYNSPARRYFSAAGADPDKTALLFITADKGLVGGFNAMAIRQCIKWLRANAHKEKYVFAAGKKGRDFLRRLKMPRLKVIGDLTGVFPKVTYAHAAMIQDVLSQSALKENIGAIEVIYNDFKSMAAQTLVQKTILPFNFDEVHGREDLTDFIFEPDMLEVLLTLLPRYMGATIYRCLLESQAAELAARMNAMEAASNNAGDIITRLGVTLNKVRQESITNELTEIISGANALND